MPTHFGFGVIALMGFLIAILILAQEPKVGAVKGFAQGSLVGFTGVLIALAMGYL